MKNLKQFIALAKKYRTMTPEMIEKLIGDKDIGFEDPQKLTGYGDFKTCTLCQSVKQLTVISGKFTGTEPDCNECVWVCLTNKRCQSGANYDTYESISESDDAEMLSYAYQNRADRMVDLLHKENLITEPLYNKLKR